ncbi:ligase-associated DNA damage response exonuclease [Sphingobacterium paludis]|uniref:Putative mRNA 3-end processing factor n=1 Tax=Sphingobacterium paludis TaxID=1476465 RepID=A0A4R7D811_9SPHI|nr:ligase-associated DNA damage response exonuclease [Sphingobacterium paludis]TDS17359.1 putative mRNA 3-end processing factor [Sphingobacterium paludis]
MNLLSVNEYGLYCKQGDFYIDPWKPVHTALITHGHSDHMRWGMSHYICHHHTVPILRLRLGEDNSVQGVAYEEELEINGVKISFHPAGHIIGSAQIRLEYQGEVWLFTGDYKLEPDGVSQPYALVKCDHLITESTFGLPVYHFPSNAAIYADINAWWRSNAAEGINTVLLGYALGKAQNILAHADERIGPIFLHGAVDNVNNALTEVGYRFAGTRITADTKRDQIRGALIVAPPSAMDTPWLRTLKPYRIAMCSGWMQLRGARRRKGVDRGFPLSDHCDWRQLNQAVIQTAAKHVYVTHGYEHNFSKWVREEYGIGGSIFKTLYNDAEEENV